MRLRLRGKLPTHVPNVVFCLLIRAQKSCRLERLDLREGERRRQIILKETPILRREVIQSVSLWRTLR